MEFVMLNTNVFGRPYDELNQNKILLQAVDSFRIFLLAAAKFITVKSSDVLFAELNLIKDEAKRELILSLVTKTCQERIKLSEEVIGIADGIYPTLKD